MAPFCCSKPFLFWSHELRKGATSLLYLEGNKRGSGQVSGLVFRVGSLGALTLSVWAGGGGGRGCFRTLGVHAPM